MKAIDSLLMQQDNITQAPLHDYMRDFAKKWSPSDVYENSEFQADFLRVVQAIHRDAMRPVENLMKNMLSATPLPPMFPHEAVK